MFMRLFNSLPIPCDLHFSNCACHHCTGAMRVFSVPFHFLQMIRGPYLITVGRLLKTFLLKKSRPSKSQESYLRDVRGYSEISRAVKKYRDPGGEEAVLKLPSNRTNTKPLVPGHPFLNHFFQITYPPLGRSRSPS